MGQSALFQNCKEAEVGALREALKLAHADIEGLRADAIRTQRASSELHHRMKNSFQLLCGALQLQERAVRGSEAADAIAGARHRIVAIGQVHAFLVGGTKSATINVGQYLTDLCDAIATSLDLRCNVSAEDCELDVGTATSVGIIVNELLINAAKHALPGVLGDAGVRVHVSRDEASQLFVRVADNGPGMPPDFDVARSTSLGLRIVLSTVADIGGTLSIGQENGAVFTVRVPLSNHPDRKSLI